MAQRQLFSLTIAAPEILRAKLRGYPVAEQVRIAARLRIQPGWDAEIKRRLKRYIVRDRYRLLEQPVRP